jgi:hypothetical protein
MCQINVNNKQRVKHYEYILLYDFKISFNK